MAEPTEKRKIEYTILREMEESVIAQKKYRVYLASTGQETPVFLSLKEIDLKRAVIYQYLCGKWHPNLASVYEVRKLSGGSVMPEKSAKSGSCSITDDQVLSDCNKGIGEIGPEYLAVMEYVPGKSLSDEVYNNGPLDPQTALLYAHQIAEGLAFLHQMGLVHKDIKPDNIIITKGKKPGEKTVKIIDLGIAETYDPRKIYATESGGTRGYRAPEVNDYVATPRSDVFSLGCVLNFMLCGYDPSQKRYSGNPELEKIVEKASDPEDSYRYSSVSDFIKAIEHAQKKHLIDKIPLLCRIPGYRSHTWWKMLLSSCVYAYLALCIALYMVQGKYEKAAVFTMADLILPWIFSFDIFYLTHYLPERFRRSRMKIRYLKILILILCLLLPWICGLGFPGEGILGQFAACL